MAKISNGHNFESILDQDAVAMRLQQVLECAAKLSHETKAKLKIDWSALIAMRNKISAKIA